MNILCLVGIFLFAVTVLILSSLPTQTGGGRHNQEDADNAREDYAREIGFHIGEKP